MTKFTDVKTKLLSELNKMQRVALSFGWTGLDRRTFSHIDNFRKK